MSDQKNLILEKTSELISLLPKGTQKVSHYPEELKVVVLALRASGFTYQTISDTLNIALGTVHSWVNNTNPSQIDYSELSENIKKILSSKTYSLANHVLSRISDEDIEKASLLQKGTFSAMMIDKGRLLEGQSTENISILYKRCEKIKSKKDALDEEINALEQLLHSKA